MARSAGPTARSEGNQTRSAEGDTEGDTGRLAGGAGSQSSAESRSSPDREVDESERRSVRVTITNQPDGSDSTVAVADDTDSTCQIVEYASPVLRELINSLPEGAVVTVEVERVVARGNCWRVLGVHAVSGEHRTS
ncbi:hypothetical protein ACFQL1_19320 [Halomicroarcula sp. GCM10025709]|uniref:hypothetical protein n=1 Tax=Haloarcula TaxID=2237 RepID=UPI0024C36705|nr:hypothetical protein [Halomicroarcula sp. YJ-61-S]